jgi:hypothetical protein
MKTSLVAMTLVLGCGAPSSNAGPLDGAPDVPRIEGRAALDRPLSESSEEVRRLFARFEEMRADEAPRCAVPFAELAQCLRGSWTPWLARRAETIEELVVLEAIAATDAERLLAAIMHAVAVDDIVRGFDRVEVPREAPADIVRAIEDELARTASEFAVRARSMYSECASRSEAAPEVMRAWGPVCRARSAELDALIRNAPARPEPPPVRRGTEMPAECRTLARVRAPLADPPNEARPRRIAIVLDDEILERDSREALLDALYDRVDAHTDLPIIARAQVAAAERTRAERRLTSRGPVCGQPFPFELVLQQQNPNLVIASVTSIEYVDDPRERLQVRFWRPGAEDLHGGLPDALEAEIRGDVTDAAALLDAATRLAPVSTGGLGLLGTLEEGPSVRVGEIDDESPWLAIDDTLRSLDVRTALGACLPEGAAASARATLTVGRDGSSSGVTLEPVSIPDGADRDALRACFTAALERIAWPCTRSGGPEEITTLVCVAR